MKVLVTNDDGVASPGLWALADGLREAGHEVVVVAPAEERSGSGAAIGYLLPGHGVAASPVERAGWESTAWAVDGPPALCVLLALRHGAFGSGFQAVASGINPGWNTGRGVIHSGTVGAVLTGGVNGLPGVAVSIDASTGQIGEVGLHPGQREHWAAAAALAGGAVDWLATLPPPEDGAGLAMLNLNVPNQPLDEVPGVRAATLSRSGPSRARRPPRTVEGEGHLRLELPPPALDPAPGTDLALLRRGFATVTALTAVGEAQAGEAAAVLAGLGGGGVPGP